MLPLIAAVALTAVVCWYAWRHTETPGASTLGWLAFLAGLWAFGYIMEIGSQALEVKVFWGKVQYLGIVGVPMTWLAFALRYTNRGGALTRRFVVPWVAVALITDAVVWTTEWHGLVWRTMAISPDPGLPVLVLTYGPAFWANWIWAQVQLFAGTYLFLQHSRVTPALYRWQTALIIIAALAPWIGNALYVLRLLPAPWANLDLTPPAFAIAGAIVAWDIFRFRLLDVAPVARKVVVDGMQAGVIVLDIRDHLVEANPMAYRVATIVPGAVGKPLAQVFPFWPALLDFCRQNQEGHSELVRHEANGTQRWYHVTISPLRERPGRQSGRLIMLHDITERKQIEQTLSLARDQALEASRLKSRLLAKVSHELRTPLGAILGYTELLRNGRYGALSEKQNQIMERVVQSTHYLSKLINELLEQALLESGKVKLRLAPFTPRVMLQQVCEPMSVLAEAKGLSLTSEIAPDVPPTLIGDQTRLQQILMNLLGNAIKFTSQGEVKVRMFLNGSYTWALQVSDSGPGIPAAAQPQVFEAFWQLNDSQSGEDTGYGLGLSMVKQLADLMNAHVDLESAPGRGSTFTVIFPLQPEAQP